MASRHLPRAASSEPAVDASPALDAPFAGGQSLAGMRYAVTAHGAALGLSGERLEAMVVIVHELCANAVIHGGGRGRLRLWLGRDAVYCEVSDKGSGMAGNRPTSAPPPAYERGRGIFFVQQLADSVQIRSGPTGTVVTAAIELPHG